MNKTNEQCLRAHFESDSFTTNADIITNAFTRLPVHSQFQSLPFLAPKVQPRIIFIRICNYICLAKQVIAEEIRKFERERGKIKPCYLTRSAWNPNIFHDKLNRTERSL